MSHLLCLGDVALHYTDAGKGDPVVFVHGGGNDLTYWDDHIDAFAGRYHVITYSRRYAEPNRNTPIDPHYGPPTDARDLAALVTALELGPSHIIAHSIGGVAALFCAVHHPMLVRTLVLAEPPLLRWAADEGEGAAEWRRFLEVMWAPAAAAFRRGDAADAMRIVTDYFVGDGTFARLPPRTRERLMRNARDWEAFTTSSTPFPILERAQVGALDLPALMFSAGRTVPLHRIVDDLLSETLPDVERVHLSDATHDVWSDRPLECRDATLDFLARRGG